MRKWGSTKTIADVRYHTIEHMRARTRRRERETVSGSSSGPRVHHDSHIALRVAAAKLCRKGNCPTPRHCFAASRGTSGPLQKWCNIALTKRTPLKRKKVSQTPGSERPAGVSMSVEMIAAVATTWPAAS